MFSFDHKTLLYFPVLQMGASLCVYIHLCTHCGLLRKWLPLLLVKGFVSKEQKVSWTFRTLGERATHICMGKSLINRVVENTSRSSEDLTTLHRWSNSQESHLVASQRNNPDSWGIWNHKNVRAVTVDQTKSPCSPVSGLDSNLQPMFKET